MKGWLTIRSASEYCDTGQRTIREWLKEGLQHSRVRGRGKILIKIQWLDEWLENFAVEDNRVDRIVNEVCKEFDL